MSNHDELSGTTLGGKLGCLVGALVGFPVLGALMFISFYLARIRVRELRNEWVR